MPETLTFRADIPDEGLRIDTFLQRHMEESRSLIQRWIKKDRVTVNGRECKASQRLRSADEIEVKPLPPPAMHLVPEDLPLSIVFEDEYLVVVDKPAGMVVHPGAGNHTGTLVNALLYHFERISRGGTIRPGIVHRLDKDTSGLLVVAKTDRAHDHLARQFKQRLVAKLYLCLVHGLVESDRGEIDLPVGRHAGRRTRMSTRSRAPRFALTGYRVIRRFPRFSYLEVKPHTGRTHQIRVHLEHIGHPVVGDPVYCANRKQGQADSPAGRLIGQLSRQFLHASMLGFAHPVTGSAQNFESPLAGNLATILDLLE